MGSFMSTTERADRGRDEPIDVEFEPAEREYRGSRGVSGTTALAMAIVAAGIGAAGGAVAPRLPQVSAALDQAFPDSSETAQGPTPSGAAELDSRLDRIEAILNAPLAAAASGDVGDAGTAARLFAMQAGLRDVETRLSQMPSTEQVTALVTEVRAMQEQLPAIAAEARQASIASRAAFALTATTEASSTSGPFEQSYASLQALLPQDPNVAALAPLARTGAPTRAELRDRFDRIDNDIIRAAREAQAGAGFWGRIQAALAQWIIVRQSGEGDTPAGVIERASQRLAADDLAGAIQEVNRLSGASKRVAQPWLNDAQRRLEIDRRLAAIRTELSRGA
jgi:hypothetical protein